MSEPTQVLPVPVMGGIVLPDDDDDDEKRDVTMLVELRNRLAMVRQQRQTLRQLRQECQNQREQVVWPRLNELLLKRQEAVEEYQSVVMKRQATVQYLDLALRWNVVNDCFPIGHIGPWATINGARLGGVAPRLSPGLSHHLVPAASPSSSPSSSTPQEPQQQQKRSLLWSSVAPSPPESPSNAAAAATQTNDSSTMNKVSWPEINAALGHVVLLLQLLIDRCGWSITHELLPLASASQIGVRRRPAKSLFGGGTFSSQQLQPPVFYNLYFDESSFSLFKGGSMRQFQLGLVALLECMVEIATADKTIVLPHAISLDDHDKTSATIGGISMIYGETTEFTQACKYLLTNLKWLVAFVVKHHMT